MHPRQPSAWPSRISARRTAPRRGDRNELGFFRNRFHGARNAIGLEAGADDTDFYLGHGAILARHSAHRDAPHQAMGGQLAEIADDGITTHRERPASTEAGVDV